MLDAGTVRQELDDSAINYKYTRNVSARVQMCAVVLVALDLNHTHYLCHINELQAKYSKYNRSYIVTDSLIKSNIKCHVNEI